MDTITLDQKHRILNLIRQSNEIQSDPSKTDEQKGDNYRFVAGYKACMVNLLGYDWTFQLMDEAMGVKK